jgi:putative membrane protein
VVAFAAMLTVPAILCSAQSKTNIYRDTGSERMLATPDVAFAINAAQSGTAEIKMGQLALSKSANPAVRKFGQQMIDDHTKANDRLKEIARQQSITLPANMKAKDQARYIKLQTLFGVRFDQAYIKAMLKDHEDDIKAFRKEVKSGKDPAIESFAAQTLPMLQEHLSAAKAVDAEVMSSGS